jgi:uncharacterized BrkB/YihY/UPF0761 family membrane protein
LLPKKQTNNGLPKCLAKLFHKKKKNWENHKIFIVIIIVILLPFIIIIIIVIVVVVVVAVASYIYHLGQNQDFIYKGSDIILK